jgi:hypothetical protein
MRPSVDFDYLTRAFLWGHQWPRETLLVGPNGVMRILLLDLSGLEKMVLMVFIWVKEML